MPSKEYREQRALAGNPIVDKRKRPGDRHRPNYERKPQPYKKVETKWKRRHVVAWDGEGANLETGEHVYSLLANNLGNHIIDHKGLRTKVVFEFFLDYGRDNDINVIFGGSYDVNMILKDVDKDHLQLLWNNGKVRWQQYEIHYAPRKKFTVKRLSLKGQPIKTFVLWDVIGYFQSTFVMACERWLGDLPILEDIQRMKLQRSTFQAEQIEEIIEYNRKECILLVWLCERLFASLDEAHVELKRFDGAGSIAAELLRMNNVKEYKGEPPPLINRWAQYAYSGGRIEAVKCGTTTKPTKIFRYDINSAYPYGCLSLPSYNGAKWTKGRKRNGSNNSLVCVKYHFATEAPFYPLWYRDPNGSISYPREGYGVYWGSEVSNLYKYYQEGTDFQVEWAFNCTLQDMSEPFQFIEELFQLRKKFKAEGSMASESLKLGLNSIYGKLVQQAGYRNNRIPAYHQLLWGGQITALTRARLFDAAMQSPSDVISFATDAVFTTKRLDLTTSPELGDWSLDEFQGITIVQAGVYFLQEENGEWYEKFRGFDKGSLQREAIVKCWAEGSEYEARLTRFVTMGSALMATDFSIWRTWSSAARKLDIRPTGKRIAGTRTDYSKGLRSTKPCPNITPDTLSTPYAIAWVDGQSQSSKMMVEGVTLEVLVDEAEDGTL